MPLLTVLSFTSFKSLRKLFSYKCFTEMPVSLSDISSSSFGASLEELVCLSRTQLCVGLLMASLSLISLQSSEFLDLSSDSYRNLGVPLFSGEEPRLKEMRLSGNLLGGDSGTHCFDLPPIPATLQCGTAPPPQNTRPVVPAIYAAVIEEDFV
ncbi:hypothetical protein DKX38_002032 [Salix brachista]|uniref:Uncharacterized protein n=1 Tax=Salix brachista TaxID=2182728 RepID=A0A5N5NM13_9ROSI|nr:hypothetical protein DKX38_002032 [Salix brachista]